MLSSLFNLGTVAGFLFALFVWPRLVSTYQTWRGAQ